MLNYHYPDMFIHSNDVVKDKINIVNTCEKNFYVGSELATNIEKINNSSIYKYLYRPITHSMFLNETNNSDILEVVK